MVLLMSTSCLLYLKYSDRNFYLPRVIIEILAIAFPIGASIMTLENLSIQSLRLGLLILLVYIAMVFIIYSLIKKLNLHDTESIIKYSKFIIISIILILLTSGTMKLIWGRIRFFPMLQLNDFSKFTNWWEIIVGTPSSSPFRSFPSGHTASAASLLVLIFAPQVFKDSIHKSSTINFMYYFPVVWTILVQLSRIMDGAHFLTDVSASLLIAVIVISILYTSILKQKK